jgi:gamma-glutamylcyclotransferase (GGCT)/AIG2-like uncharacterized protein YtfP
MTSISNFKFFVYGTLRPDIKASYSDLVYKNKDFKIRHLKACIFNAKLYYFVKRDYPTIMFTNDSNDKVHGYLIESDDSNKLRDVLDSIESYPDLFNKTQKIIYLKDENNNITDEKVEAYVYYSTEFANQYNHSNIDLLNTEEFSEIKTGCYLNKD